MTVGAVGAHSNAAWQNAGNQPRNERIDVAVRYFVSQGWTHAQAAGIVANLMAESGVDPHRAQMGGGPGYGIGQWEGPRQAEFAQWAGHDIHGSSLQEQLGFVQYELTHGESAAGSRLRGATSAGDAAAIVCQYYERPADTAGQSRYRAGLANDIFSGSSPGTSGTPASTGGTTAGANPAAMQGGDHLIQRGDTLWGIAMRAGISLASMIRANPQFGNPNLIFPGQQANVPGSAMGDGTMATGGITAANDIDGDVNGTDAAAIARHYMGRFESDLQRAGITLDCPTSLSCANFVTSMLVKSGQFDAGSMSRAQRVSVSAMAQFLKSQGWRVVPASQAKPGDVWVSAGHSHTELVNNNDGGKVTLIGSNNHPNPGDQQINLDGSSASNAGSYILAPPA